MPLSCTTAPGKAPILFHYRPAKSSAGRIWPAPGDRSYLDQLGSHSLQVMVAGSPTWEDACYQPLTWNDHRSRQQKCVSFTASCLSVVTLQIEAASAKASCPALCLFIPRSLKGSPNLSHLLIKDLPGFEANGGPWIATSFGRSWRGWMHFIEHCTIISCTFRLSCCQICFSTSPSPPLSFETCPLSRFFPSCLLCIKVCSVFAGFD